jgi:hypothetical protein
VSLSLAAALFRAHCFVCEFVTGEPALAYAPLLASPERLAQFVLEDLAGSGERQRIFANINVARAFITGNQRLAEFDQFVGRDLGAAPGHDHGVNPLAPSFVRNSFRYAAMPATYGVRLSWKY